MIPAVSDIAAVDGHVRLTCPQCSRGRIFRIAELFEQGQKVVTIRKACPHCGSDTPLRIEAPPVQAPAHDLDLWSAILRQRGRGAA
jgi:hypothetical protein